MMNCVVNMLDLSWAHLLNWDGSGVSHRDASFSESKGAHMSCLALVVCCGMWKTLCWTCGHAGRLNAHLMTLNFWLWGGRMCDLRCGH